MFDSQISKALRALEAKEKQYNAEYLSALDIQDYDMFLKAQKDSSSRIRLIKKWKSELSGILKELNESGIVLAMDEGAGPAELANDEAMQQQRGNPLKDSYSQPIGSPYGEPPLNSQSSRYETAPSAFQMPSQEPEKLMPKYEASPVQREQQRQQLDRVEADREPIAHTQEQNPFEGSPYEDYVWEKLKALSISGHRFSFAELLDLQSKRWSKTEFGMDISFARVYRASVDLASQIKDEFGKSVYFAEPLEFGGNKLLFASNWSEAGKTAFDKWLAELEDDGIEEQQAFGQQTTVSQPKPDSEPVKALFFGKEAFFKDKKEAYAKLCEALLLRKPYDVASFSDSDALNPGSEINFSYEPIKAGEGAYALKNGLFVRMGLTDAQIEALMSTMLAECGLAAQDAVFL